MTATSLTGLRAGLHRRRRFGGHSGRRARQFDRETAAAPESGTQLDARPEQRGDACADRQAQAEPPFLARFAARSEEHTSELQSLMRISYAVFCLKKKKKTESTKTH